jgi:hypothetical protein
MNGPLGSTSDQRMRPGSFGLLGQVDPIMPPTGLMPAASYERDPTRWMLLNWYDRATGGPIAVTAATPDRQPAEFTEATATGAVALRSLASVLAGHPHRPEHKSLAPDGGPATGTVKGLLQPRPIQSAPALTRLIGKEGNKLLERLTGEVTDPDDYLTTYTDPATNPWPSLVLPVLRDIRDVLGARQFAREVGVSDRQVRNWLNDDVVPHAGASGHRQRAEKLAVSWCVDQLRAAGHRPPADPYATLYLYLTVSHP